jgi:hypothetical protein
MNIITDSTALNLDDKYAAFCVTDDPGHLPFKRGWVVLAVLLTDEAVTMIEEKPVWEAYHGGGGYLHKESCAVPHMQRRARFLMAQLKDWAWKELTEEAKDAKAKATEMKDALGKAEKEKQSAELEKQKLMRRIEEVRKQQAEVEMRAAALDAHLGKVRAAIGEIRLKEIIGEDA